MNDAVFVVLGLGPGIRVIKMDDFEEPAGAAPAEELGGIAAEDLDILEAGAADAVGSVEMELVCMLHGEEVGRRIAGGSLEKKSALAAPDLDLDRPGWIGEQRSQVKITGTRTIENVVWQGRQSIAANFGVAGDKVTFFGKA